MAGLHDGGWVAATPITSYRAGMKVKGTLKRTDIEGGHWTLQADDGEQYQLVGKVDGATDGQRVEVEGGGGQGRQECDGHRDDGCPPERAEADRALIR
jgi:hypothetical protein